MTLRVGIAGAGFVGGVHARSARLAGATLVGVTASTPQRSAQAAERLGTERVFATSEELVTAADVDVVHICTPNNSHAPLARAALEAGKHVVCEKPLALDSAEAAGIVEAAERSGRVAAVPFICRFYPLVREARHRVQSGQVGDVRLIHGSYLQDWLMAEGDDNWRVAADQGGASRAFADIGSHWCDLARFLTGDRIAQVSARTVTAIPQRRRAANREAFSRADNEGELVTVDTEDAAVMMFQTERGATGSVVVSQISPGRKNRLWIEVDGSAESVVFDQEAPELLWCGGRDAASVVPRDPAVLSPDAARISTLPGGHTEGYALAFDGFVRDVYAAVQTGELPEGLPTFQDGLEAARVVDAVLASSRTGQWTEVLRN